MKSSISSRCSRNQRLTQIGETDPELRDAIADERLQRMEFGAADLLANTGNVSFDVADPLNLIGRDISHFESWSSSPVAEWALYIGQRTPV